MKIFGFNISRNHTPQNVAVKGSGFEERSIAAARAELRTMQNRYEAAQPGTPSRSWVPAFTRDARYDANSFTRWELTRKIRYFERNVWVVGALKKAYTKYVVGPFGLPVIPASSDAKWNSRMFAAYANWCKSPCVDTRANMGTVHKLLAGERHIDGGAFVLKTRSKAPGQQSQPKIKLIESHRCSSPGTAFATDDNPNIVDGVEVDGDGQPIGYHIRDGFLGDEWRYFDAASVIHVFEQSRIGQYREITPYAPVLNKTHDLDDLDILEMEKAKQNAEISYWLQTWNGEIPPSMMRNERFLHNSAVPPGNRAPDKEMEKRLEQFKLALRAKVFSLKPGEEVKQMLNNSPTAAQQWYWRMCVAQVCGNLGIPVLLILPESLQGTVTRTVLDDASIFFRSEFDLFVQPAKDIYLFFAQWARYNVPGLQDAPADWDKCHVIPPRAVNVDQGRNSAAMLAELAAGTTNFSDIAGEEGTTAEMLIRKKASDVKMIHDVAAEYGIEPAEISAPIADILQKLSLAQQANASTDNAPAREETPEHQEQPV